MLSFTHFILLSSLLINRSLYNIFLIHSKQNPFYTIFYDPLITDDRRFTATAIMYNGMAVVQVFTISSKSVTRPHIRCIRFKKRRIIRKLRTNIDTSQNFKRVRSIIFSKITLFIIFINRKNLSV